MYFKINNADMVVVFWRSGYLDKVWEFIRDVVPEFKLPEEPLTEPKASFVDTKKMSEIKNDTPAPIKQTEKPEKTEKAEKTGKGMQTVLQL